MKLTHFFLLLACTVSLTSAGDEGFVQIFNGKDLEGWDHREGTWEVRSGDGEAGEIWCTGKSETKNWLIWREKQPENFILKLEFLWEKGNSGVQVRSDDLGDHQIFGYQVEVAQQDVMGLWHHSLLAKDHPRKKERHLMATAGQVSTIEENGARTIEQVEDPEKVKSHYKEKEWNQLEVIAEGNKIIQKINGVVFSTIIDNDKKMSRKKGFIALQDHGKGCTVAFRNIQLRELK